MGEWGVEEWMDRLVDGRLEGVREVGEWADGRIDG